MTPAAPPAFAAALFDMDGLLIDSERVILSAWLEASRHHGHALTQEDYVAVIGRNGPESREILIELLGGAGPFRAVRSHAAALMAALPDEPRFPLKPGVVELLSVLRAAGIPCAVASSSNADEIRHRLGQVGVLDHFDAVSGGNEVPRGKPDPAVYLLAAERIGVPAARCLAFEDSENGALAALASGAQLVMVPDLKHPAPHVAERSLHVLPSLHHAIAHVPAWFGAPLP
jgi:HAD superfamily hydrolase (TIGR01509 family)